MTKYILDHAAGRDCTIMYEGKNGVTRRSIHVLSVDEHRICGLEDNQLKTFRRDRILAATWQHAYEPSHGQYANNSPVSHSSNAT
jgi:hypothetical protein